MFEPDDVEDFNVFSHVVQSMMEAGEDDSEGRQGEGEEDIVEAFIPLGKGDSVPQEVDLGIVQCPMCHQSHRIVATFRDYDEEGVPVYTAECPDQNIDSVEVQLDFPPDSQ